MPFTDAIDEAEIEGAKAALEGVKHRKQMLRDERRRLENEERCIKLQEKRLKKIIAAGQNDDKESNDRTQNQLPSDGNPVFDPSDVVLISSTATTSDLPGPGRGIGKLYSRGGRILERSISLIAHKLGFGPYAVALRMMKLFPGFWLTFMFGKLGMYDSIGAFIRGWNRLLMYIEHGTPRTRVTGLQQLASLLVISKLHDIQLNGDLMRRSIRAVNSNEEHIFDSSIELQQASYGALALIHIDRDHPLLSCINALRQRLYLLQEITLRLWYTDVMHIFHDTLVELYSRILYEPVRETLGTYMRLMSHDSVDYASELHQVAFEDLIFAQYPCPELLRESARRIISIAERDILSGSISVRWPRDDDPLSIRVAIAGTHDGWNCRNPTFYFRKRARSGCLELDDSEFTMLSLPCWVYGAPCITKKCRVEELFIPDAVLYDTAQSSSAAVSKGEFIIAEEHRHDLEIWRREISEVGRRPGVYLGRPGTFVMKKWEVGVLPWRVLYEGEISPHALDEYLCIDSLFGKLDPWRMGLVAFRSSREGAMWMSDQKPRSKDRFRLSSAIKRR